MSAQSVVRVFGPLALYASAFDQELRSRGYTHESAHFHLAGSMLLGGVLGAALFLILVADHPYAGPLRIEPSDLAGNLHTYALIDAGSRAAPAG
jgi:hypothetical protein